MAFLKHMIEYGKSRRKSRSSERPCEVQDLFQSASISDAETLETMRRYSDEVTSPLWGTGLYTRSSDSST